MKKENKKQDETAVAAPAAAGVPAMPDDVAAFFEENEGDGVDFRADEVAIPMMIKLAELTGWVQDKHPGAEPGRFMHTSSMTVHKHFDVMVAFFQKSRTLWAGTTKDDKGQFIERLDADMDIGDVVYDKAKRNFFLKDNPEVCYKESFQYFGLLFGENGEDLGPGMFTLKRSQIQIARKLNGVLQARSTEVNGKRVQAPVYGFKYRVTTAPAISKDGKRYTDFVFSTGEVMLDMKLLLRAKRLRHSMVLNSSQLEKAGHAADVDDAA